MAATLNAVLSSIAAGKATAACMQLGAFINQVRAQAAKDQLSADEAATLITDATRIENGLGC